jgi:hypothetical protein
MPIRGAIISGNQRYAGVVPRAPTRTRTRVQFRAIFGNQWHHTYLDERSVSGPSGTSGCLQCAMSWESRKLWPATLRRSSGRGVIRHWRVAAMMSSTCTMLTRLLPLSTPPADVYVERQVQIPVGKAMRSGEHLHADRALGAAIAR